MNQSILEFLKAAAEEQNGIDEDAFRRDERNVNENDERPSLKSKVLGRRMTSVDFENSSSLDALFTDQGYYINYNMESDSVADMGRTVKTEERAERIQKKLKSAFNLSTDDTLVAEFSCSLISYVLIKGYMYITNNHVCFFASMNRKKILSSEYSGFLHLKTSTSRSPSTYWFVLREETLSYYANSVDVYCPLDVIDLRYVISIKQEESKNTIHIVTPDKSLSIQADTSMSMKEWARDIVEVMCILRNGDSVKLALPLKRIVNVELTSSFNQHDSLRIRCFKNENSAAMDEYYFTYFHDPRQVRDQILAYLPDLGHSNHRSIILAPIKERHPHISKGLSEIASVFSKIYLSDNSDDRLSERSSPSGSKARQSQYSHHDSYEEESHETGHWWIPPIPNLTRKHRSLEQKEYELRKLFALSLTERLIKSFTGALLRTLPTRGRVHVSDHHILFKSKAIGDPLKVMVPFNDIYDIQKHSGCMLFSYGVYFLTISQTEIVIAFRTKRTRDEFFDLISSILKLNQTKAGNDQKQSAFYEELPALTKSTINTVPSLSYPVFGTDSTMKELKSLHITCLTIGTRGDVQPYIALCKGLMKYNHRCCIATHREYKQWIESHGIEFREVAGDPAELMRLCVDNGMFSVSFIKEGIAKFRGWLDDLLVTAWEACQGTDLLIESPSAMAGVHIAEKLNIPFYWCFTMPWTRTRSYPHPFAVSDHRIGGGFNYMTYVFFEQVFWKATSWQINKWRKSHLSLESTSPDKLAIHKVPFLYCFSEEIVPPAPDWFDWVHLCGYWFLDNSDHSWVPPQSLLDFLKIEPKPVYIGFGSIVVHDPEQMTHVIIEGVRKAGVRAIVSKGWSSRLQHEGKAPMEKTEFPDFIYSLDSVPHDWLFPQVAGVMHHGGAGTTSAGIRAGIPTVIRPFFGDQFFWGNRIQEIGIGICLKKFTVDKVAQALQTITTDTKMIKRSQLIGNKVKAEDGVENAINYIFRDYQLAKNRMQDPEDEYSTSSITLNFEASSDEEYTEEEFTSSSVDIRFD